ncbi:MAG: response regulator, partial [Christensenellaceae bacterium]|nr:response regulator [Christensenellaceae bacterium]
MLKVIIADDEQRICRLIKALVDWDSLEMKIVAMANNGIEALEKIESLKPDILITDIRMPGYDGLELIKKAREVNRKLEAIVISGYAQFDYAQTAISYGVGEYLLKPINKEQINASLAKIKNKLKNETQQNISHNKTTRQKFLIDISTSNFSERNFDAIVQKYNINLKEDITQFLMAKVDGDALNAQAMLVIKNKFEEKFESILKTLCTEFEFVCINNAIVGIINYSNQNKYMFREKLRNLINELIAGKDIYGNVDFTFALSKSFNNINNIQNHFEEIYSVIAERLVEGVGILLEAGDLQISNLNVNFKNSYLDEIIMAIDTLNISYAYKALNNIKGI